MIVPSKNQKTYGALHTENYFSFLGFCKKVNSNEIQKVDVYLDDVLIDTIIADKHLQKIEDIYELEGFGFEYILPNEYVGQKGLINFKNHDTQENLQNSPYELIKENHPKFKEASFLNSIEYPINRQKVEDTNNNSIGFLAIEENLKSPKFVNYIKNLIIRFPNVQIKAFMFKESQKELINNTFNNIKCIYASDITDIANEIEVFIWDMNQLDLKIVQNFMKNLEHVFPIYNFNNPYFINLEGKTLLDFDNFYKEKNELILRNAESVGFTNEEILLYKNSYHKLVYGSLMSRELGIKFEIDLKLNALEFLLFTQTEFALTYKNFRKDFIKMHKLRNGY